VDDVPTTSIRSRLCSFLNRLATMLRQIGLRFQSLSKALHRLQPAPRGAPAGRSRSAHRRWIHPLGRPRRQPASPTSIVADCRGIYYDPASPSDLEIILAETRFSDALLCRARALRDKLVASRITKYNLGNDTLVGGTGADTLLGGTGNDDLILLGDTTGVGLVDGGTNSSNTLSTSRGDVLAFDNVLDLTSIASCKVAGIETISMTPNSVPDGAAVARKIVDHVAVGLAGLQDEGVVAGTAAEGVRAAPPSMRLAPLLPAMTLPSALPVPDRPSVASSVKPTRLAPMIRLAEQATAVVPSKSSLMLRLVRARQHLPVR
jgi:hypothetical protein